MREERSARIKASSGRAALLAFLAGAVCLSGCASALRGGDQDLAVHLATTYAMARAAGFDPGDARKIAASNYYTDEHPETSSVATERRIVAGIANPLVLPSVFFSTIFDSMTGRETPLRALGANAAAFTSWNLSPLALKLHFPARTIYDPTAPAFAKDSRGELLYTKQRDALVVLEQAFLSIELHDRDEGRTLALLGIALHVVQDSYKHASFSGARGHIGVHPTPDDLASDPGMALEIAEATFLCLRHARVRMDPRPLPPAADWKAILRFVYGAAAAPAAGGEEGWRSAVRSAFGEDPGSWSDLRSQWMQAGGDEDFERALEKVRRVLR
jgi:hypothetical protein